MRIKNSDDFDLIEAMNLMQIEAPDKLVENFRNHKKFTGKLDKL
jgi:hypothetical protein